MKPDLLLAHDLGTSGNKATLFDFSGALIKSRTTAYTNGTRYYNGTWAEQSPDDWWEAVCRSTGELLDGIDPSRVAAVALSGQMMGSTPIDADGRPLHPSMIYCDSRGTAEAETLAGRIDPARLYRITGHRLSPVYAIEKFLWFKNHFPDEFKKCRVTLAAKDYINFRLTGQIATDPSDASGTNAFDLTSWDWSDEILDAAGLSRDFFPPVKPSTEILGTITSEASAATGLRAGTPVAVGGGDGSCAGVGVGSVAPGGCYNYLGSSAWVGMTTEKPIFDPLERTMTWAHCVPGLYHPTGSVQTAGSSYSWLANEIGTSELAEAEKSGRSVYEIINGKIASAAPGSGGVLFLPYMLGERSPRWNPNARGAFIGMNLATTRAEMFRSVLEGVTMNLGLIVRIFRESVDIDRITVIGGGAKGAVWRQMMADIYDAPIQKLNVLEEATSMGAAMLAGVAAGAFRDFSAIERFIAVEETLVPNRENQKVYEALLPIFDEAYFALCGVYDRLCGFETAH